MKLNKRGAPKGASGPPAVFLPPPIYGLFAPHPAPLWKPKPGMKARHRALLRNRLTGVSALVKLLEVRNEKAEDGIEAGEVSEGKRVQLTPRELLQQKKERKLEAADMKLKDAIALWDPNAPDSKHTKDAYKTLFVGRLSKKVTSEALKVAMQDYGDVANVCIVEDLNGNSRGYAFVEFMTEPALRMAFKRAGGRMIEGKRIVVDVERGRTVRGWKPRRLGGGLGGESRKSIPVRALSPRLAARSPRMDVRGRRQQQDRHRGGGSNNYSSRNYREDGWRSGYGGKGRDDRRRDDRRDDRRDRRYDERPPRRFERRHSGGDRRYDRGRFAHSGGERWPRGTGTRGDRRDSGYRRRDSDRQRQMGSARHPNRHY